MPSPTVQHAVRLRLHEDLLAIQALDDAMAQARQEHENATATIQELKGSLELLQASLAARERRAERLESHIAQMAREGDALRASADSSRKILRTMATLPFDILALIFSEASQSSHGTPNQHVNWKAMRVPYDFASVCRHWRRVALATPAIWRYIAVSGRAMENRETRPFMQHLTRTIARSGTRSLDVVIDPSMMDLDEDGICSATSRERFLDFWTTFFAKMIPTALRLRTFIVQASMEHFDEPIFTTFRANLLDLLRCQTPLLEELCLHFDNAQISEFTHYLDFPVKRFPCFIPEAPSLRRLTLRGVPFVLMLPHAALHSLTHLSLSNEVMFAVHLWDTLSLAPNLESLVIAINEPCYESSEHTASRAASLPMSTLTINGDVFADLFKSPQPAMPNLTTLDVQDWVFEDLVITDALALTLTRLTIGMHDSEIRPQQFVQMRAMRSLEYASMTYEETMEGDEAMLYDALCSRDEPMWPHLRTFQIMSLRYRGEGGNDDERDGLLRLLQARNQREEDADATPDDTAAVTIPIESLTFDSESVPPWIAVQLKSILGEKCYEID